MYKIIADFHFCFHLEHNVFNEFQNDCKEIDCALEQLWAIREGLSNGGLNDENSGKSNKR